MELDIRKQKILSAIIETYIQTGEPVGSKAICELFNNSLSSATIRNEMAALAEMGFLDQPHTSAGRVPSNTAFRLYINELLNTKPLTEQEQQQINTYLAPYYYDQPKLIHQAGSLLAKLTGCASLVLSSSPENACVLRIETIPLNRRNIMVVVIATDGSYKNKICRTDFDMNAELMQYFSNFATEHIEGTPISELTIPKVQSLSLLLNENILILSPLLLTVFEICSDMSQGDFILDGQSNLLSYKEFSSVAREIIDLLSSPTELIAILPKEINGVKVLLGDETNRKELLNSSVITTMYNKNDNILGTLGVIGPIRMDYSKIIPHLEYFASIFGKLFSEEF